MGAATGDFDDDGDVDLYLTNFGPQPALAQPGRRHLRRRHGAERGRRSGAGACRRRSSTTTATAGSTSSSPTTSTSGSRSTSVCRMASGALDYCGPSSYAPVRRPPLPQPRRRHLRGRHARAPGSAPHKGAGLGVARSRRRRRRLARSLRRQRPAAELPLAQPRRRQPSRRSRSSPAARSTPTARRRRAWASPPPTSTPTAISTCSCQPDRRDAHPVPQRGPAVSSATPRSRWAWPSRRSTFTGFGAAFLDADNDGALDLLVVNGAVRKLEALVRAGDPYPLRQRNQLFRNVGGRFTDVSSTAGDAFARAEVGRGALFGDLDDDGDTDVVVANNEGPARLLAQRRRLAPALDRPRGGGGIAVAPRARRRGRARARRAAADRGARGNRRQLRVGARSAGSLRSRRRRDAGARPRALAGWRGRALRRRSRSIATRR